MESLCELGATERKPRSPMIARDLMSHGPRHAGTGHRALLSLLVTPGLLGLPWPSRAQQSVRLPGIGVLWFASLSLPGVRANMAIFRQRLSELGHALAKATWSA